MAAAETQLGQEESMEGILESIKRHIESDDTHDAAPDTSDVLDLTQAVKEDNQVVSLGKAPRVENAGLENADDIVKSIDSIFAQGGKSYDMGDSLLSEQVTEAAVAALKPISDTSTLKDTSIPYIPSLALRTGNTVEDLLLEALRPMLKEWLDDHLPTIVNKIVEKEVKRLVTFHTSN